mgnify:CR=1 FL=1
MSSSDPDPPTGHGRQTWFPDQMAEAGSGSPEVERYQFEKRIGEGGMGEIWRAYDNVLRRHVAVKVVKAAVISDALLTRFAQEAQVTGQLEHPNIVPVHDLGRTSAGHLFFTMKEVRGQALNDVIRDTWSTIQAEPGLRETEIRRLVGVLMRVCEAVAFAHARGVIHRDLKPDNIMVGEFGEVQVMDWGLARVLGESAGAVLAVSSDRSTSASNHTQMGRIAGTPAYMSPEQAWGETARLGAPSDAWAVGAILYEIVSGQPAFAGEVQVILNKVRTHTLQPPSAVASVPRELEAVVMRAMDPDMEARYTVDQIRQDLEAWMGGMALEAVDYSPVELAFKWARRNQALVRGVAVTSVVAAAVLGILVFRYVADVTHANEVARAEAANARAAEQQALIRLAQGQVATADAKSANQEFLAAQGLYQEALTALEAADQPTLAPKLGMWRTQHESQRALFRAPGELVGTHPDQGSIYIRRGQELVQLGLPMPNVLATWPAPPGLYAGKGVVDGRPVMYSKSDGWLLRTVLPDGPSERFIEMPKSHVVHVAPDESVVFSGSPYENHKMSRRRADGGWSETELDDGLYAMWFRENYVMRTRYGGNSELWTLSPFAKVREVDPSYTRTAVGPDGRTLVVYVEEDQSLRTEDLLTGHVIWERPSQHMSPVGFSPDGQYVFVKGLVPYQLALDLQTGEPVMRYEEGDQSSTQRVHLPDVWVTTSSSLDVWPYPTRPLGELIDHMTMADLEMSADGALLAVIDEALEIRDAVDGTILGQWPLPGVGVRVDFDPTGSWVVATTKSEGALVVDLRAGIAREIEVGVDANAVEIEGPHLYVAYRDGSMRKLEWATGHPVWATPAMTGSIRWDLAVDETRNRLYSSVFRAEKIDVTDLATGELIDEWGVGGSPYDLSVWGERVAVGTASRKLRVFDAEGAVVFDLEGCGGPPLDNAPSPDGRWLASADYGYPVRIFDLSTGSLAYTDETHDSPTARVWWSPDGSISSSDATGRVVRRDLAARQILERGAHLLSRMASGETLSDTENVEAGRAFSIRGMNAVAAPLLATADGVEQARAWAGAGDSQRALQQVGPVEGESLLRVLWRRKLEE